MKDNRGLTLVELLITVTILALVIAGAATFMLAGSQSFAKGSADSNVQGEAELAVNQIEDLIIDVNGGVDYVINDSDDSAANHPTETLVMYHVEADNSGVAVNKRRTVKWDKEENNIYSGEWIVEKDGSGAYVETSTVYDKQLLAENVTDFNVDLSDKYIETAKDGTDIEIVRSVVIRVDCLDGTGKSTYATTPTITLRNRLMISSSPEEIFNNTPTSDESLLLYISSTGMEGALPIRDRVTTVERGKVYNIFVMVNVGTNVNSLCDFTVEGETSGELSTITPEGVHIALDVNTDEPNDYLKITATYKTNSAKTVSGWVRVIGGEGKSLEGCKILPESEAAFAPSYGSTVWFSPNFTAEDEAALEYIWTVDKPDWVESFVNDTDRLELKVTKRPENDQLLKIKITLVVKSPTTNQSVSDWVYYIIPLEGTSGGDSLVERGKVGGEGYHGDNWYSFTPPFWTQDENIKGECYFVDLETGQRISAYDYLLDRVVLKVGHTNYYLTMKDDLPPENEYYLKIIVYYHYEDQWSGEVKDWKYSRIHNIPAVKLYGHDCKCSSSEILGGAHVKFTYDLIGYYERSFVGQDGYTAACEYEVVELNCDMPEGYELRIADIGGPTTTKTSVTAECVFEHDVPWNLKDQMKLKSMKIKVSLKGHPSVCTYVNVTFE